MEAVGFWPRGNEPCGRRRSGIRYAQRGEFYSSCTHLTRFSFAFRNASDPFFASSHCTVMFTVAMLLARFGSGVSAIVAAFSVITVPAGAVTFTTTLTVHVVFGAMALFS